MNQAIDKDYLDNNKAKILLDEFRKTVGNDPIENEIKKQKEKKYIEERNEKIQFK